MNTYEYPAEVVHERVAQRKRLDAEIKLMRATLLNIQAMAERGQPIDHTKLAAQCRHALEPKST